MSTRSILECSHEAGQVELGPRLGRPRSRIRCTCSKCGAEWIEVKRRILLTDQAIRELRLTHLVKPPIFALDDLKELGRPCLGDLVLKIYDAYGRLADERANSPEARHWDSFIIQRHMRELYGFGGGES